MVERFCAKCGRLFIPAPQHIYRDYNGMYCSWTCYNHRDTITSGKKIKRVAQYTKNGELLRVFNSAEQAADYVDKSVSSIRKACLYRKVLLDCYWKYTE